MGFNLGALAGGMASGIESGVAMQDNAQARALKRAQLDAFNSSNLAQQAFTNSQIPGISVGQAEPSQPIISQIPVIGPMLSSLGLWGSPPPPGQAPSPMPRQGGFLPPGQQAAPPPQASAAPPQGGSAPMQQPQDNPMAIAQAIDIANPGLKQKNPTAFAQAVKIGIEYAQGQRMQGMDIRLKEAQIRGSDSENKLRDAQVSNIPFDQDIKRQQVAAQRAETEVKQGELLLQPAKQKYIEAQTKLEEIKADNAQVEMRLREAESRRQDGDSASLKEWRDAQMASLRSERMLKMQQQKTNELKTKAEISELGTRSKENEAGARLKDAQAVAAPNKDANKAESEELTGARMQLRFHENQINDLMTSINPASKDIKQRVAMHQAEAAKYQNKIKQLEEKTTTLKQPAAQPAPEIPAPRQTELNKISQKFLELARRDDVAGAKRLKDLMAAKGVPQHEIEWALQNARTLGQTAPTTTVPNPFQAGPQVPQGY